MSSTDYYRVLQVDPAADPEVIEAAYKRLALKLHPDRNKAPDATERFRALQQAYEILRDPEKRAGYDRVRAAESYRPPHPYFVPTVLDFGELRRSASKALDLTCHNDGGLPSTAQLTLSSDAAWFTVDVVSQASAPDGFCPIRIRITATGPGGTGSLNEWISVTLDDVTAMAELRLTAKELEHPSATAREPSRDEQARERQRRQSESATNAEIAAIETDIASRWHTIRWAIGIVIGVVMLVLITGSLEDSLEYSSPPSLSGCVTGVVWALLALLTLVGAFVGVPVATIVAVVQFLTIWSRKARLERLRMRKGVT